MKKIIRRIINLYNKMEKETCKEFVLSVLDILTDGFKHPLVYKCTYCNKIYFGKRCFECGGDEWERGKWW